MRKFLESWPERMLSVLRVETGLLFLAHGTSKLMHFPTGPTDAVQAVSRVSVHSLVSVLEFTGGVLIVLGVFTRSVALILFGEMAVTYWTVHARDGAYPIFNSGEPAILYCFIFLYLAVAGGGEWSIDTLTSPFPSLGRAKGVGSSARRKRSAAT